VSLWAAWFTAYIDTIEEPLVTASSDVLVDGWLYNFFATLLRQGFTEPDLTVIFYRVRMEARLTSVRRPARGGTVAGPA
jgi:hypothetical protein